MALQTSSAYVTETAQYGTTLYFYQKVNGVLTDATSVTLADAGSAYGIIRLDNHVVSVASGAAVTHITTGIYSYDASALDPRFTYIVSWAAVNSWGTTYSAQLLNPPGTVVTRGQIRAAAARLMGLLVAEGITTAATTTTITDASVRNGGLVSDSDSANRFDGCFVLMTSGPASGVWRECSTGNYAPSTGVLQVAAQWPSVSLPSGMGGDSYEVYAGLSPDQWSLRDTYTIVDSGLERCRFYRRSPLTLAVDGDMEAAGVNAWTASNATIVKTAVESVITGAQGLLVVNTGANGYAQSTAVGVSPTRAVSAWVDYRCASTGLSTATLIAWDNTNNVQLATGTASDASAGVDFEGSRQYVTFSVPNNCYSVVFRLQGTEAGAVIAWDDLIVMTSGRRRYQSPAWIKNRNQIMSYAVRNGSRPWEDDYIMVGFPNDIQEDPSALNTFIVDLPMVAAGKPVFAIGLGAYGPQAGTADGYETACPLEWAKRSCAREAWQVLARNYEQSSMPRVNMDRATIEMLAIQADQDYMPTFENAVGDNNPRAGLSVLRMP